MKIVHISDLHFGEHNEILSKDLLGRIGKIKPDLILCTGDVVDNTHDDLFDDANVYLQKLAGACPAIPDGEPSLIVVPGNHDYFKKGIFWRDRKDRYGAYFGAETTDHFFKTQGVWVFGFDSASEGMTGGGGRIRDEDLERFHVRYLALENEESFREAFEIVAVHHHPLPVNWDSDWKQRWLTMSNAGAFLSAALLRRVDLVLHGHEHLQARSRLISTLGGQDGFQLTVVSLGATLRKVDNPGRNWFSVISIAAPSVTAEFYPSVGVAFDKTPESFVIHSLQKQSENGFAAARDNSGFSIERLVAYSILTADGDAKRIVECESLKRSGDADPLAGGLEFQIPYTTGYLDKLRIVKSNLSLTALPAGEQRREFKATVSCSGASEEAFAYSWYTVNSFAMDTAQFALQYSPQDSKGSDGTEFTHFGISHPVEEITMVVQFPEGFHPAELTPRAWSATGSPPPWNSAPDLENELRASKALRFYEAMNVASLRVPYPRIGRSYGIQWQVPKAPQSSGKPGKEERQIQELKKRWTESPRTPEELTAVLDHFAYILKAARVDLMDDWNEELEASFFYFDHPTRSLIVLAAGRIGEENRPVDYGKFRLPYGMGIAGRAFKTNRARIYAPSEREDPDELDFYYRSPETPSHVVLACIPIQNPEAPEYGPYGVFCIGSDRADCPLAYLLSDTGPESAGEKKLNEYQQSLNGEILKGFVRIYLNRKAGKAPGAAGTIDSAPGKE